MTEEKKVVYVNSRERLSGDNSDFSYKINFPDENKYTKVSLIDISIPKSYYMVNNGKNQFTRNEIVTGKLIL